MEGHATPAPSPPPLADVRLIVKSANQQFEDLIIHSEATWTIRKLKAHLTKVYPSNPTVPEQKLIYSGQLLSDDLILKDILRSYKDVETENHIFHLVYTPKMSTTKPNVPEQKQEKPPSPPSPPMPSTSADGLRHRNVPSSSTAPVTPTPITTQVPQQIPNITNPFTIPQMAGAAAAAAGCPNNFPNPGFAYPNVMQFTFPGQFSNGMVPEHQAAVYNWVQQIYANYMDQCLRMANATINGAQMQPQPQPQAPSIPLLIPQPFIPQPQFLPQNFPVAPQVATASSAPAAKASSIPTVEADGPTTSRAAAASFAPRVIPVIPKATQPQPQANDATSSATAVPAPAPAPAENVDQPQPRFPNIVQEEQDNRDWLDSFYSVTRFLALLTLVYFYSSPIRCLVVALIAVGIYLYHIGFFQTRRPVQANNTNNNNNNNNNQNINDNNAQADNVAPAQEEDPLIRNTGADPAGGDAAPASAAPSTTSEPVTSSVTPPEAEPSATSLIAFVRTFVVSFFTSLLPETPAL